MKTNSYISRRPDRKKQTEAKAALRGRAMFALRMGMRTGKTKVIVDDWGEAVDAGQQDDLLVIAPGGAYLPWGRAVLDDLPRHLADKTWIYTWESKREKTKAREKQRAAFLSHAGFRVLLVNVEALSSVKAARDFVVEFMKQRPGRSTAAVDESVTIKEEDSNCGKFCADVLAPLASRRRILTGLITPRSPLDLWNQFRFLDPAILGHDSFSTFRARYAKVKQVCMLPNKMVYAKLRSAAGVGSHMTTTEVAQKIKLLDPEINLAGMPPDQMRAYLEVMVDGMPRDRAVESILKLGRYIQTIPIIEEYRNVGELHDKIAPHSYVCRLEDCYDMPPSDWSFRDVDLTSEQERIYRELKEQATSQLSEMDHVTATHVVVRMLRLHQVLCGHTKDEHQKLHAIPERRTRALLDLLDDYEGKAVVWCSYDYNVRAVAAALEEEYGEGSVARFWGGNVGTREEEEVGFKTDPRVRFQVGTPDAGGYGRDWSVADLVVFFSSKNDLDHRAQAEDRAKADGKKRPIAYVDLRARGTVEEKIIHCLREKIDMASTINGEEWRRWLV